MEVAMRSEMLVFTFRTMSSRSAYKGSPIPMLNRMRGSRTNRLITSLSIELRERNDTTILSISIVKHDKISS